MQSNELWDSKFTREIRFSKAFDKRNTDPKKNFGIHGMNFRFLLKGPEGIVQFLFYSGIMLPAVADELAEKAMGFRTWMGADLGYHSPKPVWEGQAEMPCDLMPTGKCYYDGSGLQAEVVADAFVSEGEDAVWKYMREFYAYQFEGGRHG